MRGHVEMVKYLQRYIKYFNPYDVYIKITPEDNFGNKLEMIKYLKLPIKSFNYNVIKYAVETNDLEMVKYLRTYTKGDGTKLKIKQHDINVAKRNGNMEMVEYLENKMMEDKKNKKWRC